MQDEIEFLTRRRNDLKLEIAKMELEKQVEEKRYNDQMQASIQRAKQGRKIAILLLAIDVSMVAIVWVIDNLLPKSYY